MQCPRCRQDNPPQAKFCLECAAPLAGAVCGKCGSLLPAAAKFCPECAHPVGHGPAEAESVPTAPRPVPVPEAERRQLTVMFCDLVGSTALSTRLDPEDLREVVRAYQAVCAELIARFDGHIAQYLGDGLLVYFGYPQAHEDDAQRAVRAGLGIVEAVGRLKAGGDQQLSVRVGIHTGPVVVGQVGGGGRHEQLALGETPNVAARLQTLAEPDRVVISALTHRLVGGFFRCRELGPQSLKGVSELVRAFEVVEEGPARSRFDVATPGGLTPLVGREQEVGLLLDRWERACEGHGQVVLLTGEPGIGKSRLVQILKERVAEAPHRRLEARCSPYYEHTPLYPIIDLLPRVFDWSRDDSPDEKFAKLEQRLDETGVGLTEIVPLLASLLSLPASDRYPLPPMSPQRQKQKTLEAVLGFFPAAATRHPALLIFEDLHWVDPTTVEFVTALLDQVPTARLLVLLTARPSFTTPWPGRSYLTPITLSRLTSRQTEALVSRIAEGKILPGEVLQQIVAKTDGVPLFVEELTKMVLESGLLREAGEGYELTGPLPPLAIPATLQDSLMARLDRLAQIKEVAQLAATLGRAFPYALIRAVSTLDEPTLQRELSRLVDAELLYKRGMPPEATYIFKHALIQEAAYQSLLKSTRQQYHQRIAQAMVEQFPDETKTRPEFVAHHYTEAGLDPQAIEYWERAGQRAVERSAHVEAMAHLTKGLKALKTLPETPERAERELALQLALGAPLQATKGYAAPERKHAYGRAWELCQQVGETPQRFAVLFGLWQCYAMGAEWRTARAVGEQLLSLAQRQPDPGYLLEAHRALAFTLLWLGEFVSALAHAEQGMALYDSRQHHAHAFLYGQDPGMSCRSYAAEALWGLGYPDKALVRSSEALAIAKERSHPYSVAWALGHVAIVHQLRREAPATQERAEATMMLCKEQGFPFYLAMGTLLRGWARAEQGAREEAVGQIRQGFAAWRSTGTDACQVYISVLLAEAQGKIGQAEAGLRVGLRVLTEALALVDKMGERFYAVELHRLQGELLLQKAVPDAPQAETSFREALSIARHQQAKSLELRAAMSLARLRQRQGKRVEARDLLAPIYGWFTEGFDTPDLKDAEALLDNLA